jgi:hypothetical protein
MTSSSKNGTAAALQVKTKDGVKFGKELREREFLFGNGYLNLNHGMFIGSFYLLQLENILRHSLLALFVYASSFASALAICLPIHALRIYANSSQALLAPSLALSATLCALSRTSARLNQTRSSFTNTLVTLMKLVKPWQRYCNNSHNGVMLTSYIQPHKTPSVTIW